MLRYINIITRSKDLRKEYKYSQVFEILKRMKLMVKTGYSVIKGTIM
jgi:hypothetical protein